MKIPEAFITEISEGLHGKKIFLTGGTGFFGLSLLDFLLRIKKEKKLRLDLYILSRDPEVFLKTHPQYKGLDWTHFVKGDICSFDFPAMKFDYILHFATPASATMNQEQPTKMYEIIVEGTKHVLNFSQKIGAKKILFSSSGAVYGPQPANISHLPEEMTSNSQLASAYGEGKRIAESLGATFSKDNGPDFLIARCFAFVGPYLDRNGAYAIGNFIRDAQNEKDILIQGDGRPLRSYLYSDDLIVWLFTILLKGQSCRPYNVGSDQAISIRDLAELVRSKINPKVAVTVKAKVNPSEPVPQYVPSIERAKSELGLAVWTSLEDSIKKSI